MRKGVLIGDPIMIALGVILLMLALLVLGYAQGSLWGIKPTIVGGILGLKK